MVIDNIISVSFSDEDVEKMNAAIRMLNEVMEGKTVNLTPEKRRQYGSIADRNKLLVDKVTVSGFDMPLIYTWSTNITP